MMKYVIQTQQINLGYLKQAVADIPEERMAEQPAAGMNHPAWILGHLAGSTAFTAQLLGKNIDLPKGWQELYGMGSKPAADRAKYLSKAELLKIVEANYAKVAQMARQATAEDLAKITPIERVRDFFPTVGDGLVFMLTAHDASHLGQLSAWRRAAGLPSVW